MNTLRHNWNLIKVLVILLILSFFMTPVFAQSANSGSTSNSASNVSAQQGNQQGQEASQSLTLVQNSAPIPQYTKETIRTAPSMGIGALGVSFSNNNCSNSVAGSLSLIGVGASAGSTIVERSCSNIVQGTSFGNASNHFRETGDFEAQSRNEAMMQFDFCNTSDVNLRQCELMGLVKKVNGEYVAVVREAIRPQQPVAQQVIIGNSWQAQHEAAAAAAAKKP